MLVDLGSIGTITDVLTGERWTGPQTRVAVERRCALLARHGLEPGEVALVMHANSAAFFADLFAIWQLGACAACLDPSFTPSELAEVAQIVRPRVALVGNNSPVTPESVRALCLQDMTDDGTDNVSRGLETATRATLDDPALILFTSGTTAAPKCVVHTSRGLLARLSLNVAYIGRVALQRTLCVLPTHFGHGLIGNCLTPLHAGADLLLWGRSGFDATAELGTVLDEHAITFMSSVPAMWRMALRLAAPPQRARLRQVHVGSAPLTGVVWRDVQAWCGTDAVVNAYGITEAANWVAGASGAEQAPADGLVGRLWGGCAAVLAEDGRIRIAGEGELLLRTPSLMHGYLHRPDLTAAVMYQGWYRTGDLADITADGSLRLGERLGLEINRAGIKIHPEEVESLLERHPEVRTACVFGVPDPFGGEVVGCAVAVVAGSRAQALDIRRWCAERIRSTAVPERWWILPVIPINARGKISRREIARQCLQAEGAP